MTGDPGQPARVRRGSRVVLINDQDEVLLFRSGDLKRTNAITGQVVNYWVLPGGGLEAGESWEAAALRGLREETGIDDVELGPCIWTREKAWPHGGDVDVASERYFLVRCDAREVRTHNQLPHEQQHYDVHGWWSVDELRASGDVFFPEGLADLLVPLLAGYVGEQPLRLLA